MTKIFLYRICDECNQEFKIATIGYSQDYPIAKAQCSHCGKWNDVWVRVHFSGEKAK